jgi:FkbM family methyltransferase
MSRNHGLPIGTMALRDEMLFKVHPESIFSIEHFCHISEEMTDELDSFIRHTSDCHRLLDIGALHGVFSLAFTNHRPNKSAIAIDASPIAFSKLLYNSFSNPRCQIKPVECALSDQTGQLAMTYDWEHLVANSKINTEKTIFVPMCTGDQICIDNNFQPDCIKIDVEGHEINVLKGLAKTIQTFRPLLFLEIHPNRIQESGNQLEEVVDILMEYKYSAENIWGRSMQLREIAAAKFDMRIVIRPDELK